MAQSDTTGTIIRLGVLAALIVGGYFLYKYLKAKIFGAGGDGSGAGGRVPTPGIGGNTVLDQVKTAWAGKIANPTIEEARALELATAEIEAKKFMNKSGSSIVINKVLKVVTKLPDTEFLATVNKWLKLIGQSDFYSTNLVQAQLTSASRSDLITRYGMLTGRTSGANTTDLYTVNGHPLGAISAASKIGAAIAFNKN